VRPVAAIQDAADSHCYALCRRRHRAWIAAPTLRALSESGGLRRPWDEDAPTEARERRRGDSSMPKFITIGYGDQAGYDRTPRPIRDAAHAQDAKLRTEGALI